MVWSRGLTVQLSARQVVLCTPGTFRYFTIQDVYRIL